MKNKHIVYVILKYKLTHYLTQSNTQSNTQFNTQSNTQSNTQLKMDSQFNYTGYSYSTKIPFEYNILEALLSFSYIFIIGLIMSSPVYLLYYCFPNLSKYKFKYLLMPAMFVFGFLFGGISSVFFFQVQSEKEITSLTEDCLRIIAQIRSE